MTGIEKNCRPNPEAHARYSALFEAYRSIYPGLKPSLQLIAEKTS